MKRWIALVARLYPRAWRERYGSEFDALVEDVDHDWRELADVLRGAMRMHFRIGPSYLRLAAGMAAAGAALAVALSFGLPGRYVSSAVVRMDPPAQQAAAESLDRLQIMWQEALGRASLAELITRPSLDLYHSERRSEPLENVVDHMRRDIDIRIQGVPGSGGSGVTMRISFAYANRPKAQAVVRELVARLVDWNLEASRVRAELWQRAWNRKPPPSGTIVVVRSASEATIAPGRTRLAFLAWGLAVGGLAGFLAAFVFRRPRAALFLVGFALAGAALAWYASLLVPDSYTSVAQLRFAQPIDPERWYALQPALPADEHLRQLERVVLSDRNLARIIRHPAVDLYPRERRSAPIADIVSKMRRAIGIRMAPPPARAGRPPSAFRISFKYDDPKRAQAVVRELVVGFIEQNVIEVQDPATLPQTPVWPNRLVFAGTGLAAGSLLGAALLYLRRRPDSLHPPLDFLPDSGATSG